MNETKRQEIRKKWRVWEESLDYTGNHIEIADWWMEHMESEITRALAEQMEVCKKIFVEGPDWSEWGMDGHDAERKFNEEFKRLTQEQP